MELGGNAALLVFEDADLELAIDQAMMAKLRNMGEACTSANRLYVAAPVADEFARRMAQRMEQLRLGRGTEPDTESRRRWSRSTSTGSSRSTPFTATRQATTC
jgi:succinate-semialdehyde dehydrogenase/glutarate-semialdehyde dehydrogenase